MPRIFVVIALALSTINPVRAQTGDHGASQLNGVWTLDLSAHASTRHSSRSAEHARHFGRDRTIYDPWHCLPFLANKPGAWRNGAPFQGWDLPPALARLRRKLGEGSCGLPLEIAGVAVRPGDRLYADEDGIVILGPSQQVMSGTPVGIASAK